ncbi:MAG: YfcC family protein [Bacilli bacterium]|nr:YfcC family protein [Bacilli bacterium]
MATKKGRGNRKKRESFSLSAFTIILIITFILGAITHFLPEAKFVGDDLVNGSGVVGASFSQTLMAPVLGFADAIDICLFVLVLGAFLKVVNKTESIEDGIEVLVRKLKGRELILIPILMFVFSIGGTTYGMLEETVGFYALLSATMVMAGMDTVVASAVVLLGAGSGVLGSTINPFAVGAAVASLPEGIQVNQGIIIALGVALWLTTYIISTMFVLAYAKKVKEKKGSILSKHEHAAMMETYGDDNEEPVTKLKVGQKWTLIFFGLTFVIMIIGFIPWEDFGINVFKVTGFLTGAPLGQWYFNESTLWFAIMTIVIGVINHMREHDFVETFIDGADDMVGVILVIALARGASVLMTQTYLDNYIIYNAADALKNVPAIVFAPVNYILHAGLSVLVPSSSGLASLSTPIMGPLAANLDLSVETTIMEMVAANGLVNLFTPTCGAIMGGLALAKVEYTTWLKWVWKVVLSIALVNIAILTIAMLIL